MAGKLLAAAVCLYHLRRHSYIATASISYKICSVHTNYHGSVTGNHGQWTIMIQNSGNLPRLEQPLNTVHAEANVYHIPGTRYICMVVWWSP